MSHQAYAWELSENQAWAMKYTGLLSTLQLAFLAGSYVVYSCDIPEEFYVKNEYPYAQVWYDEMAMKYPDIHFNERSFLASKRGFFSNFTTWDISWNEIYGHRADLESIDKIYKKKADNIQLTEEETDVLNIIEFVLLDTIGLLENNFLVKDFVVETAIHSASIIALAAYRDMYPGGSQFIQIPIAFIAAHLSVCGFVRSQVAQADQFACQHAANIDVLQGGVKYFSYLRNNGIVTMAHPSAESRMQVILDEIARRSPKEIV